MVRRAGEVNEDDLFAIAAKAGKEDPAAEEGVSLKPVFLGPESGRVSDDGFETRVKPPTGDERKTDTKPKNDKKPGRPRGTASDRSAAEIAETLEEKFAMIFAPVAAVMPMTGAYGIENSPKAINALLAIGKRRPAVMRALMKVADGADALEIGRFAAGLALSVQVDMGRIPVDSLPAKVFGITDVYDKYFADTTLSDIPTVTDQVTHAARFQPVS